MTLQHPMDSHRPNDFLEDIMSEEELEQHNQELRALQVRNARHGMAVSRAKFAKFDRFEELVTKHGQINFQLLKAYDLNVNDAVSIAYSIVARFAFSSDAVDTMYGYLDYELPEDSNESLMTSVGKVSTRACWDYLEETLTVAFSKFRGGKLNRRVPKLAEFFNNLSSDDKSWIRTFYARNNGSSQVVGMVHQIICAYKFDNVDNEKQQSPLLFDYDNRATKFNNFFQFFMTAYMAIVQNDYELINSLIVGRHYHYKEINMIDAFVEDIID